MALAVSFLSSYVSHSLNFLQGKESLKAQIFLYFYTNLNDVLELKRLKLTFEVSLAMEEVKTPQSCKQKCYCGLLAKSHINHLPPLERDRIH